MRSCWGYWIDLHHRFVEASPTVEKAVTCYKADRLVASLPSFHSIQSSLAVREFHSAGEECSERDHGQVCVNLMSWHPKHIRTITAMWAQGPTFGFTMQGSSMMGRLHRGPRKTTKLSNWGVGACAGIGACPGQYGRWDLWTIHVPCSIWQRYPSASAQFQVYLSWERCSTTTVTCTSRDTKRPTHAATHYPLWLTFSKTLCEVYYMHVLHFLSTILMCPWQLMMLKISWAEGVPPLRRHSRTIF